MAPSNINTIYIIFVHCFWSFAVKIVKYWQRKVISRSVRLLRSIAFCMTWRQLNVMSVNQPFHLRNKFHFYELHGSMNATGHVQSKWRPRHLQSKWRPELCMGPVAFILPWTPEKWNSSPIFTLCFLHRFCSLFVEFWFKCCKYAAKKSYNLTCLVITFNSRHYDMTWRQLNVTSVNQLLHLSMTSLTRNVAWMSVVHGCMNLVVPK